MSLGGSQRKGPASQAKTPDTAITTPRLSLRQRLLQVFSRPTANARGELVIDAAPRREKVKRDNVPPRRLKDFEEAAMSREMYRL